MKRVELIYLCDSILDDIDLALKSYKSSKNLGLFDIFGGESITSLAKRNKIKKAKKFVRSLEEKLRILKKELKYVDNYDIDDISNIDIFFDIFLDNTLSDLYLQNKIKKSILKLEELRYKVEDIKRSLQI